jgi:signal transduction histidine kinase
VDDPRRDQIAAALRSDPVARAASGLLLASAGLVLGIAGLALLALVVAERREDAARLYAWEADGLSPSRVRTALWWRAVAVVLPAVPIGALAGAVLATLTARLVAVTAAATEARPPLVSGLGLGAATVTLASVLAGLLAVAALICAGTAREPLPRRDRGR